MSYDCNFPDERDQSFIIRDRKTCFKNSSVISLVDKTNKITENLFLSVNVIGKNRLNEKFLSFTTSGKS